MYYVRDDLNIFEFHDSEFSFENYNGNNLVISVHNLNVHKNTKQNPQEYDMEIEKAFITFKGIKNIIYKVDYVCITKENEKTDTTSFDIMYEGKEGVDKLIEAIKNEITILALESNNDKCSIDATCNGTLFSAEFIFDEVEVCWESYKKKAWYELHKEYNFDVTLFTSSGEERVNLTVFCNEEIPEHFTVNIMCKYKDNEFWGHGIDRLWIDAFADLQKNLPDGITLKCCLTCKHGNFCPVGSWENEVFCTKDVYITKKSDLYFYTEDDKERKKRYRRYCDVCEDYNSQSDDYFTYNDFNTCYERF